jgi:hypothetical protein
MVLLRVGARPLVPRLRAELALLLASLEHADCARPAGTVVTFTVEGQGGGTWHVARAAAGWELDLASSAQPACQARTTVDGALKLYARDPSAPPLTWHGDHEIADALAGVKAVLG